MARITSNDLKEILSLNYYEDNILQYYDNVTYNIRFYMLNHSFQKRLSEERLEMELDYTIPDEYKVIIAETGVSSHYDIQSLKIKATHASAYRNPSSATYQIEMRLKEVASCDLVNKIAVISKALGYDCYVQQPYHLDIWFSGYEQATGKPIKIIENMVLTYEVIVNEVKTNTDNTGTIYNFFMTPVAQASMHKYINTLFKIGEIKPINGAGGTFGDYVDRMVEVINKKYFEENPKLEPFYLANNGKAEYIVINEDGYKSNNIRDYNRIIEKASEKYEKEKITYIKYIDSLKSYRPEKNGMSMMPGYEQPQKSTISIPIPPAVTMESIENVSYKSAMIDDFISPQSQDSPIEGKMQYDSMTSFEEALQDLCFNSKTLKDYIVRPKYTVEYIRNEGGIECKRIHVDLFFSRNSYLSYFQERGKEMDTSLEAELKRRNDMQLNEARNLILNNILRKKYEWMYNGHNTELLEFTSSMDKLWYANVGIENILTVNTATNDIPKMNKNETLQLSSNLLKAFDRYVGKSTSKFSLEEALKITTKPLEPVRELASDKRIYIDDIYYSMDEDIKNLYLNTREIYEKNDTLSDSDSNEPNASVNNLTIIAKAGYGNIHGAGCLVDIELSILGDPFWLDLYSDNKVYTNESSDFNKFHHVAFKVRSAIGQDVKGQPDIENITEFSNIYQIYETESNFEEGKFTQKLKGVLDPAFMHLARIEGL